MSCFETGTVVTLPRRRAITLPDIRGATLRVTRGSVWLTEEGGRDDVVLRAGDNWLVESDGRTVVEAQNDAVFCIAGIDASALALTQASPRRTLIGTLLSWLLTLPTRPVPYV